jgi:hypothetical protein
MTFARGIQRRVLNKGSIGQMRHNGICHTIPVTRAAYGTGASLPRRKLTNKQVPFFGIVQSQAVRLNLRSYVGLKTDKLCRGDQ